MYKRGDRWYSDFISKGERYIRSHGPVTKTVAKEKDRKFRSDVASGVHIKSKNNPPFNKAMDEQLKKSQVENQPSSYKRNFHSAVYLKAHFGSKRVRSIESDQLLMRKYIKKRKELIRTKQMLQGRAEIEVTYTTINRELAFLRKMFNDLIRAGKATKNPVSLVTQFEEFPKERVLTYEEETRIITAIVNADKRYYHLKDMVTIALHTAMRQGEILSMEKRWVNLKQGIINVPRHSQKRKKRDKHVPINSMIRPILKRLVQQNLHNKYVFVNPKTENRYFRIQNSWDSILKKAGIEGKPGVDKIRFHDLRHTAATNLARAGKDIKFIAQYLGHADVKTSARYIHYSDDDLKKGAETLVRVPSVFTTLK